MKARFLRFAGMKSRACRASTVGLFLALFAPGSAVAQGTPGQHVARTPEGYRLCSGAIPGVRAITACQCRQKAGLSETCAMLE